MKGKKKRKGLTSRFKTRGSCAARLVIGGGTIIRKSKVESRRFYKGISISFSFVFRVFNILGFRFGASMVQWSLRKIKKRRQFVQIALHFVSIKRERESNGRTVSLLFPFSFFFFFVFFVFLFLT